MSWTTGSKLFLEMIDAFEDADIDTDTRKLLYESLIPLFESYDCDTLDECLGKDKAFDVIYKQLTSEYDDTGEEE
jgi:hypothetical protein